MPSEWPLFSSSIVTVFRLGARVQRVNNVSELKTSSDVGVMNLNVVSQQCQHTESSTYRICLQIRLLHASSAIVYFLLQDFGSQRTRLKAAPSNKLANFLLLAPRALGP
jgi:hypothetical protein